MNFLSFPPLRTRVHARAENYDSELHLQGTTPYDPQTSKHKSLYKTKINKDIQSINTYQPVGLQTVRDHLRSGIVAVRRTAEQIVRHWIELEPNFQGSSIRTFDS